MNGSGSDTPSGVTGEFSPPPLRLALIGVGLIGGSVGLAARSRMPETTEIAGYDPTPGVLDEAVKLGAITRAATSVEDAAADADVIVLASPVGTLVSNARSALAAARHDAVVTDVGSTKREIVAAIDDPRFIGGHPIAGAETSGVEHARADLFEESTWFVTPTENSTGVGLERLMRFIRGLGAQPHALEAVAHDRLLADISHLPHVLANALVTQAADSLKHGEGAVVVGPSFRDATRVAGANSKIWRDIYLSNHDALVPAIDSVIGRLTEFRDAVNRRDGDEIVRLNEAAREDRKTLLEQELVGAEAVELRVIVQNEPGVLAKLTLELGKAGINIVDLALAPAVDRRSGAISLWLAGEESAERAVALIENLGFPVARA
ncbi:MAG: prephenate dehydrogenase/arogenate dehydrogenase family protein [Actinobacteria bacterium]|nr:prephenate dehydrogenase/arogenate dehydrogenase family protein [Actinomycetota bacterium]